MPISYKNVGLTNPEEVVAWTLDFISTALDSLDMTEGWKLSVDAYKHLRLWDISSTDGEIYTEPPKIDLRSLQNGLKAAFDSCLKPFLTEGNHNNIVLHLSGKWPPRVFVVNEGELFCTRLVDEKIETVGVANFLDAVQALTPLPLERFSKCEGCDRWFFPTGKRIRKERRFCSRACNLRDTARRQRERMKKATSTARVRKIRFKAGQANKTTGEGNDGDTD